MRDELSFRASMDLIARKWRTFGLVAVVAILLGALLSSPLVITPRYRSMATVYPVNLTSYSTETRTDQLLQLLESNSIRDSLIKRFDLATVYEADTTQRGGYFVLYNEFKDRVEISKTRYESVMIEILDEDPRRARDMVLAMLEQVNLLARRLQREKSFEVLEIAERAMRHERVKLDSVEARLNVLRRETGLLSYKDQVRELTRGLVRMIQAGAPQGRVDEVRAMIRELERKGGEFNELTEMGDLFRKNYDRLLTEYEKVVNDVTKELTYTNVVVYPEIADKKVYPVRWLIVLLSTVSALFLCFILLTWRERDS